MYPDRIDIIFLIMYRTAHLLDFAQMISDRDIHEYQESLVWALAERTINKLLMEPDFQCFPYWPTSCPAFSNVH